MGRLVIQQNLIALGFEGTFSVLISFIRVCELKKSNKTTKYFLSDAYSSGFVFQLKFEYRFIQTGSGSGPIKFHFLSEFY